MAFKGVKFNTEPMEKDKLNVHVPCGCCSGFGCLNLLLFIFIIWALWFSVPTPWGELSIDIFPPNIELTK